MDLIGSYSSSREESDIIENFSDDNNEIIVIGDFFNSEDMDDAECTRYDFLYCSLLHSRQGYLAWNKCELWIREVI